MNIFVSPSLLYPSMYFSASAFSLHLSLSLCLYIFQQFFFIFQRLLRRRWENERENRDNYFLCSIFFQLFAEKLFLVVCIHTLRLRLWGWRWRRWGDRGEFPHLLFVCRYHWSMNMCIYMLMLWFNYSCVYLMQWGALQKRSDCEFNMCRFVWFCR